MAAMVMVRVMGGEGDGAAEVVGEGKEGEKENAVFIPPNCIYLPRYLSQEH